MRVLQFFTNLPAAVQVATAVTGVLGGGTGAIFVSAIVDPVEKKPEYGFESSVERNIIPQEYIPEDKKQAQQVRLIKEEAKKEPVRVAMKVDRKDPKETFVPEKKKASKKTDEPKKPLGMRLVEQLPEPPKTEEKAEPQKPERPPYEKPGKAPVKPSTAPPKTPVIKEETTITIHEETVTDQQAEWIRQFNAGAFSFSNGDHGRIKSGRKEPVLYQKQVQRKDLNKNRTWPVKKDQNTYPTDLSRVITKEKFIRAITINRIVSTLQGRVLLQVSKNVYGAQGNLVLIPKGAKGSGFYNPVDKIGNDRISIYIERFVTEDGQLILFKDPAVAGDQQGSTGVTGDVDHKYAQKFGLPLIFSFANNLANVGVMKAIEAAEGTKDDEDDPTIASELFDNEWQKNQQATNQQIVNEIIKENINITETITIPKATEIVVYLNHDVWFRPNRNGQVIEAVRLDAAGQEKSQ